MADENTRPEGSDAPRAASRSSLDQQFGGAAPRSQSGSTSGSFRSDQQRDAGRQESDEERRRRIGAERAGADGARPVPPASTTAINPVSGRQHGDEPPRGQVFRTALSGVDHSLPVDPPPPASEPASMGTPEERERAEQGIEGGPVGSEALRTPGPSAAVPNPGDNLRESLLEQGAYPTGSEEDEREARGGTDLGDSKAEARQEDADSEESRRRRGALRDDR